MSRHLVKEGNIIGWKEDPTEEDYILTYEKPDTIGWKQGPEERTVLTKDGELIGWRNLLIEETFPGEVMTTQLVSNLMVDYGWGNLPTQVSNRGLVLATEGFGSSIAWDPASEAHIFENSSHIGYSSAKFGVDVHLEIEFVIGDGPHPEMIYKGDVPAGTEVAVTGHPSDNFFNISVGRHGTSLFEHNHFYNGVIEVRATPITPPPTYNITKGGTATSYWTMGKTTYQESSSAQSFSINYSRTGWQIDSVTITRLGSYGGLAPIVTGSSPTFRTVTIPAGSYGDFRINLSQKEIPTLPKTASPSITGTPTCTSETFGGSTYLNFTVKNNENAEVTIRIGSRVLGTIPANGTKSFSISYQLPGSYSLSITAQASNKERSNIVNKSGNILFCVQM